MAMCGLLSSQVRTWGKTPGLISSPDPAEVKPQRSTPWSWAAKIPWAQPGSLQTPTTIIGRYWDEPKHHHKPFSSLGTWTFQCFQFFSRTTAPQMRHFLPTLLLSWPWALFWTSRPTRQKGNLSADVCGQTWARSGDLLFGNGSDQVPSASLQRSPCCRPVSEIVDLSTCCLMFSQHLNFAHQLKQSSVRKFVHLIHRVFMCGTY